MVVLVTLGEALPFEAELLAALSGSAHHYPGAEHQRERTNRIPGDKQPRAAGEGVIRDKIHELAFEISPLSFFQNNPSQTDVLYSQGAGIQPS